MKTVEEYFRHAKECEGLIKTALTAEHREMLQRMADTWRMMAESRKTMLKANEVVGGK